MFDVGTIVQNIKAIELYDCFDTYGNIDAGSAGIVLASNADHTEILLFNHNEALFDSDNVFFCAEDNDCVEEEHAVCNWKIADTLPHSDSALLLTCKFKRALANYESKQLATAIIEATSIQLNQYSRDGKTIYIVSRYIDSELIMSDTEEQLLGNSEMHYLSINLQSAADLYRRTCLEHIDCAVALANAAK